MRPRRHLDTRSHPPRQIRLEGLLINIAVPAHLTSSLNHYRPIKKRPLNSIQHSLRPFPPFASIGAICGDVPHRSSCIQVHSRVVRPLNVIEFATVERVVGAVVDGVCGRDHPDAARPVPCSIRPFGKRAVAGIHS